MVISTIWTLKRLPPLMLATGTCLGTLSAIDLVGVNYDPMLTRPEFCDGTPDQYRTSEKKSIVMKNATEQPQIRKFIRCDYEVELVSSTSWASQAVLHFTLVFTRMLSNTSFFKTFILWKKDFKRHFAFLIGLIKTHQLHFSIHSLTLVIHEVLFS